MNTLKRTTGTEDQKNQVALEDKANSDAKKARSEQVRRNSLTEEQRQAEDNQKAAEKAFNDHKNKEDVEKRTQEVFKQNGVEYPKKERKGTGPLCDLGNISGKGSRPENLGQISSGIVAGRKRSIRLEGEYSEDSRQGSRKGSRKGSSIWTLKGSERQELYNLIDAKLKSEGHPWDYVYTVTGKDYEDSAYSEFAEMPENKDWINGLILEITRDRQGSAPKSRKGSRKGFGFGYSQVVLHEISPKQITSIPGGGIVHDAGQVYKIERLPEFEPNEWIHKLVIWTDPDPDSGWDYTYDYCDWE